jgi:hypothetical protein
MSNLDFAKRRLNESGYASTGKFYTNSRTPTIIAMLKEGIPPRNIAKTLGCSVSHVSNVANRHVHGPRKFTIPPLVDAHYVELWRQAEELNTTAGDLARAYIIDGIEENRKKK